MNNRIDDPASQARIRKMKIALEKLRAQYQDDSM